MSEKLRNPNFFTERREQKEAAIVTANKRVGDRAAYGNFVQNWNASIDNDETYEKRVARKEALRIIPRNEDEQKEFEDLLGAIELWEKQMANAEKNEISIDEARFKKIKSLGDPDNSVGDSTLPL